VQKGFDFGLRQGGGLMATKPKVPKFDAPVFDDRGRFTREWYEFFARLPASGDYQLTVGGAGPADALPATPKGYETAVINNEIVVRPFYDPA
jgi:hypothetical protein